MGARTRGQIARTETATISEIKSLTTELGTHRQQKSDLGEKLSQLPALEEQLKEAEAKEQQITKNSAALKARKSEVDGFSSQSSALAVRLSYVERLSEAVSEWKEQIASLLQHGAASTDNHVQTRGQFKVKSVEKSFFDLYSLDVQGNLTNAT